jgi:hypothetical protein
MNGNGARLVNDHIVVVFMYNLNFIVEHGNFMAMLDVRNSIAILYHITWSFYLTIYAYFARFDQLQYALIHTSAAKLGRINVQQSPVEPI